MIELQHRGLVIGWPGSTAGPDAIPAVGGAMDLVAGVKTIFVITQHVTRKGLPKLVKECSFPLTDDGWQGV